MDTWGHIFGYIRTSNNGFQQDISTIHFCALKNNTPFHSLALISSTSLWTVVWILPRNYLLSFRNIRRALHERASVRDCESYHTHHTFETLLKYKDHGVDKPLCPLTRGDFFTLTTWWHRWSRSSTPWPNHRPSPKNSAGDGKFKGERKMMRGGKQQKNHKIFNMYQDQL